MIRCAVRWNKNFFIYLFTPLIYRDVKLFLDAGYRAGIAGSSLLRRRIRDARRECAFRVGYRAVNERGVFFSFSFSFFLRGLICSAVREEAF